VVKVGTTEEPMIVYTFRKGMCPGPFCESIIRSRPKTFAEIRRRAVEHIASEGEVCEKRTSVAPARPRAQSRAQPARVHEAATGRNNEDRKHPYEAKRPQARGAPYQRGVVSSTRRLGTISTTAWRWAISWMSS